MKTIIFALLALSAFGQATINAPAITLNAESTTAVLAWMSTQAARPNTTLSGAVLVGDLTITVADGTGFGAGSVIAIDSEHLTVTARSGGTLTVTRGTNGTTPAAHANRAPVTELKYKTLNQLGKAIVVEALQSIIERQEFQAAQAAAVTAAKAKAAAGVQ